jgi:hypothetical protein
LCVTHSCCKRHGLCARNKGSADLVDVNLVGGEGVRQRAVGEGEGAVFAVDGDGAARVDALEGDVFCLGLFAEVEDVLVGLAVVDAPGAF